MPQLASFGGLAIYVYFADHNPPHVHAFYGGQEVLMEIATGEVYRGSLPPTQLRRLGDWVAAHRNELLGAWARASVQETPERIPSS